MLGKTVAAAETKEKKEIFALRLTKKEESCEFG